MRTRVGHSFWFRAIRHGVTISHSFNEQDDVIVGFVGHFLSNLEQDLNEFGTAVHK